MINKLEEKGIDDEGILQRFEELKSQLEKVKAEFRGNTKHIYQRHESTYGVREEKSRSGCQRDTIP